MNRITLLALGFLSLGLVTSASAQTKVTQLIIQNGNGTTKLSQILGGLTVDNYLILQNPGNANSKITLNVPNTGNNSNFYFPAVGGTLLTGASNPANGDSIIAAINMGTTQINEARLNLSNYVTNSSLASTLLNYVTNSSLATTLGGYVTNTYLTSNYSTTTDMNTAISTAVAGAGGGTLSSTTLAVNATTTLTQSQLAQYHAWFITPSGNRDLILGNGSTPGQLLTIVNVATGTGNKLTFTDGANLNVPSSPYALLSGSSMSFIWTGTAWHCTGVSVN